MRRTLPLIAVSAVVIALLSEPPRPPSAEAPPLLPRPDVLRIVGRGYLNLVADYYWIQTIQAVGRATSAENARFVADYANLVADLDPKFRELYVFAAAAIAWPVEPNRYANVDEATALLERGRENVPDHVLLRILLAYNLATFEHQYARAAQILTEASKLPDAPEYLAGYATRMYAQAGDFDSGLSLTEAMIDTAKEPETRAEFERRRNEILLERELRRVDATIAQFQAREGRPPGSIEELVAKHDLPELPVDPLGGRIELGSDGKSRSTAAQKRLGIHSEDTR